MNTAEKITAVFTLARKEMTRVLRIWQQTILPSSITMTLYFVIFGNLIGRRVGEMSGISYIDFIVPGLIMMAVITNSYANVSSSFFSAKFMKNIEELLVSPVPESLIIAGYVLGGMFRGLLVAITVTLVSMFFTELSFYNIWVVISMVMLTSILFCLAGLFNGIVARKFDDINLIPTFVLTPLTYLGGVFYSIDLLPEFWQSISHLNPVLYMVNSFRYGFLGQSDISLDVAYGVIAVFIVILFSLSLFLMKRAKGMRR